MKTSTAAALALGAILCAPVAVHNQAAHRTITIDTTELTAPALAVAADGRTLMFSALGHLYQLPVAGGATTQVTFGVSYDSDPAVSPDGTRVAFVSNRDGSGSNVFVLDLASKRVTQLSHDIESTRPAWSPDGKTIAYVRNLAREEHPIEQMPGFADTGLRELHTVPAAGGAATKVATATRNIETVFYLPDGRLAWTARQQSAGGGMFQSTRQSHIEALEANGETKLLASAVGDIGRVVLGPKGDGVYYALRGQIQFLSFGTIVPADAAPPAGGGPGVGAPATSGADDGQAAGLRVRDAGTRLAIARDGSALFFGDRGGLWRAPLPTGEAQKIPFTASMTLDVHPRVEPKWQAPSSAAASVAVHPVLAPQLSPDGARLAVMAGGFLWEQPLGAGGAARQLFDSPAFSRDPAYSPDGKSLAYVSSENGKRELRVMDLTTRQARVLFTTGGASWPLAPDWSPDGTRIVFAHAASLGMPFRIVIITVADGAMKEVAQSVGSWIARPQFSGDGRSVYFTSRPAKIGTLYRVSLQGDAKPEAVTDLTRHVHEGAVSHDGQWMAQRRNSEIWIAPMAALPIRDAALRRLSDEGGRAFSFTPDSKAIVYTAGGKIWRQPVAGGARVELPARLTVARGTPPPLLITRVHVLDLAAGAFGDETSMFVEGGRIKWIGAEQGKALPPNTVRVDGAGRYAIPGLFDLHVHSAWANQQTNEDAFIAFGVTSVRDTGSMVDLLTALHDRSDDTALAAPRYFYSGEIFEGAMPHWGDAFYTIGTELEARAEVRHLKAYGANFVKIYPSLPWRLQQVVADEAHKVGLPVVGHGLSPEEVTRRVIAGSTSLEHTAAVFNTYADIHQMIAKSGAGADLTLSVGGGALMRASDPEFANDWRVQEFVPEEARGPVTGGPFGGGAGQTREQLLAAYKPRFDKIMSARSRGVALQSGTDSLMGGVYFGLALHWEIAQFADAGIPAIDVLRMSTTNAAALVGAGHDLGSLTPGKLADVVLLDANPLENIRNTLKIWQVVKGGRVYDPAKLRRSATSTAAR